MPIYEYVCSTCGLKFELLRPASQSAAGAPCARCQQSAERVLSSFAAVSANEHGVTAPVAGGGSSCGGCSSTSCGSCGH